ncbi:hypothetical protein roselon_02564 [Roseibacterium elongatum DSM 19469]|uniref:Uncharacterized protein n=1 Tax=Roseicyclus elongatus DSM 19469 TaxID=1294273 RepID=W8S3U5_9RHOB|nr:hypothetical protein [Roseibacterium elongatum]AHM04882.1 hypothetical protein roselon_02564 [Roseibacterium elongatum DSM 19469]
MPLDMLLTLVIGGIAGIALLLHLFGHSAALRLDADDARRQWTRQFPDIPPSDVHLSQDRAAALIETPHGPGLVWAMGADATAHRLIGASLTETRDGLRIDVHDFAAPGLRVRLAPEARETWARLIVTQPEPKDARPA